MLRAAHRRPQTFPSWAHRPRHGKIMFPGSDISCSSGVARLVGSGSLMSSVLFLTSGMLCRFCMGFCLKQPCSTAHRARGSGGSAPRPHRAEWQTSACQRSLPCFPEVTAFCGAGFWISLLSPRSLPFLSLKVVSLAALCLLPSLRWTPSPTTLETLQVAFKTTSGCEATVHGAHQWFHHHCGDLPGVAISVDVSNVFNWSITPPSSRRCARTSPPCLGLTAVGGTTALVFQGPTMLFPRLSPVPGACSKETL